MEPYAPELLWIVILGFVIGFLLAFGVGANDVANSFGTSVGSKVLTLRQACIFATIFEILGAVLLGYKVSSTIRTGIIDIQMYSEHEKEVMFGYLSALVGSAIWNIMATFFRWPVSGTHSIVGAVMGFSLVSRGFYSIRWLTIGKIVASWFLSPVMSGLLSSATFLIVKKLILTKEDPTAKGLFSLPFFYGFTVFINVFSVIHGGPHYLGFDVIPWWGVFLIAFCVGVLIGVGIWCFLVPYLQQKISGVWDRENSENNIARPEGASESESSENNFGKLQGGLSIYPEAENPCFEGNGNHIALEQVKVEKTVSCDSDTSTSFVAEPPQNIRSVASERDATDTPESAKLFSSLQGLTAVFASFAHGANDVSNAMGPVIALWLIYVDGNVLQPSGSPFWILLYGGVGITVGLWVWGQKVIKTIGEDLTKITPSSGFTIEIGAATTVLVASKIGLPISTTHCKVGSVVFVGWLRSRAAVDWKLFRNIVLAWVLTLPVSAVLSAITMAILKAICGS